jgi:hypothetical protein
MSRAKWDKMRRQERTRVCLVDVELGIPYQAPERSRSVSWTGLQWPDRMYGRRIRKEEEAMRQEASTKQIRCRLCCAKMLEKNYAKHLAKHG